MHHILGTLLIALVAGAVGAYGFQALQGPAPEPATELSNVEDRLAALERVARGGHPPEAALAVREGGAATAPAALQSGPSTAALLETLDARVDAAVEKKITALKESGELASAGVKAVSKKRVSLADAARDLELTGPQEDGLRRIFEETNQRYFKMLAAPDGDPEDVKRELEEASRDPATARRAMTKYMPKFLSNIGEIMTIEAKKEGSINKLIGTEKADRLDREFSLREDDVLGLESNVMVSGSMEPDGR